jgi:hypothetical protein
MSDPAKEIKRSINTLVVATLILYALLAGAGFVAYNNAQDSRNDIAKVAASTHRALCTLRGDLVQRVTDTAKFLATHPDGIAGISAAAIQQSLDNQQRTIDSLDSLKC